MVSEPLYVAATAFATFAAVIEPPKPSVPVVNADATSMSNDADEHADAALHAAAPTLYAQVNETGRLAVEPFTVAVRSRADVNCDGTVDVLDVLTTLRIIVALQPPPACVANPDGLGGPALDLADAIALSQMVSAIRAIP